MGKRIIEKMLTSTFIASCLGGCGVVVSTIPDLLDKTNITDKFQNRVANEIDNYILSLNGIEFTDDEFKLAQLISKNLSKETKENSYKILIDERSKSFADDLRKLYKKVFQEAFNFAQKQQFCPTFIDVSGKTITAYNVWTQTTLENCLWELEQLSNDEICSITLKNIKKSYHKINEKIKTKAIISTCLIVPTVLYSVATHLEDNAKQKLKTEPEIEA